MAGVLLTRLDRLRQGKATVNGQTINIPPGYYGTVNGRKPQNLTDIVFARSGGNQFVAAGNQKFNNYLSGKPEDPEALALARFAIEQAVRFGPETNQFDAWRGVVQRGVRAREFDATEQENVGSLTDFGTAAGFIAQDDRRQARQKQGQP
jgi:hypothetical protein